MAVNLSNEDRNTLGAIVTDLQNMHEELGLIGLEVDEADGSPTNYLENDVEGTRLASQITTVQTMCIEASQALEAQMKG